MLSRIAESLYWVGRYVERAEDTARILDVHVHHILEDPTVGEETACRVLLGVMGTTPPPGQMDAERVVDMLGFSPSDDCSIIGALGAARENARGVREVLSTEMWECLNATWLALPAQRRQAGEMGPHVFFQFVKERAAMMAGLADSTMARDDGWRFLVLGRSLERVDMTARLLLAGFCDPSE
ncbi:MAG: alpha-E domain-containing protein, partial [Acidimicrobiales bacterium]